MKRGGNGCRIDASRWQPCAMFARRRDGTLNDDYEPVRVGFASAGRRFCLWGNCRVRRLHRKGGVGRGEEAGDNARRGQFCHVCELVNILHNVQAGGAVEDGLSLFFSSVDRIALRSACSALAGRIAERRLGPRPRKPSGFEDGSMTAICPPALPGRRNRVLGSEPKPRHGGGCTPDR